MPNPTVEFAPNLRHLVSECVSGCPTKFIVHADLLKALGCTYAVRAPNVNVQYRKPALPRAENRPVVSQAFTTLLSTLDIEMLTREDAVALLSGVVRRRLWQDCLASEDANYGFLVCLLHFSNVYRRLQSMTTGPDKKFIDRLTPAVLPILNAWLNPLEPWETCPSMEYLCKACFGSAWWEIRQPMREGTSGAPIIEAIMTDRPPFRPGLVSWGLSESLSLPDMTT